MIRIENLIEKTVDFLNLDNPDDMTKYMDIIEKYDNDSLGISQSDEKHRVKYICTYQKIIGFEPGTIHTCIIWARNKEDAAKATAEYLGCDWNDVNVNIDYDVHEERVDYKD